MVGSPPRSVQAALVVLLALSPVQANASPDTTETLNDVEQAEPTLFTTHFEGSRLWVDATAWPRPDATIFAFGLNGQWEVRRGWLINLEVPIAAGRIFGEPTDHATTGNIMIGAHAAIHVGKHLLFWVGPTLGIPTIYDIGTTNDSLAAASLATFASFANNSLDPQRFFPEYLSLNARAGVEVRIFDPFRFRVEVSVLLDLPVGRDGDGEQSQAQMWSELEAALPSDFVIGLRGTASLIVSQELNYGGGLFVGWEAPGSGFDVRVDGLLARAPIISAAYLSGAGQPTEALSLRLGYKF
jgi:hypothetical protein